MTISETTTARRYSAIAVADGLGDVRRVTGLGAGGDEVARAGIHETMTTQTTDGQRYWLTYRLHIDKRRRMRKIIMTEDMKPIMIDPQTISPNVSENGSVGHKDDNNAPRMTEDHTVVICEEVLKRREILLDMCSTRETEINRKRAEAWDEVHVATMNRCQRNLRLEQIKRVWRHQKNRVRHILNLEKLTSDMEVTLEDVIAARKGFMTDYEIAIARAYLDVPPRSHSPGNRRLEELDLSFRKRAAASPSLRIDDSVSSVLDRIAAECAEAQTHCQTDSQYSPLPAVKAEPPTQQLATPNYQDCNNILDIHRLLTSMGPTSSAHEKSSSKPVNIDSDDSSCTSEHARPIKRKKSSRRRSSILDEQLEMIKAQRVAFEEQARMYQSMRSFIEESTRTIRELAGRVSHDRSSAIDSSPSESNLEFTPNNHV
ncbi:hypothetical protein Y032_0239g3331 [Ancylostoma ceylanicum]|nr:hypothetical protein Y032_0239g3331 [Ancylostoma ceylanicum]